MLAAILGGVPGAHRERLLEVGRTVGLSCSSAVETDFGGVMGGKAAQPAGVDTVAGCAWVGDLRGALPGAGDPGDEFAMPAGAFGLVALRKSGALLVRGRFGGQPLYFARDAGGALVVCSRLAPLLSMLQRAVVLDVRRLAAVILSATHAEFQRTVYEGVSRVSSGETLIVSTAGIKAQGCRPRPPPAQARNAAEAAEELRSRLLRTVARVTQGANRVAVCASGGVDSSAVLGAAIATARGASRREAEVIAMALDFGGPGDDRPYLKALSGFLGIVPIRLGPSEFALPGPRTMVVDGAPFQWPTGDAHLSLLRRARAHGADVVLTGELGDDVFAGDMRTFAALVHNGQLLDGLTGVLSLKGTWLATRRDRLATLLLRPLAGRLFGPMPPWMRKLKARRYAWAGPVLREVRDAADQYEPTATRDILSGAARHKALDGSLYHADLSDLRGQYEAKTGCRIIHVPLDEEIADFVTSLPAPYLFCGGFHRGLLREASRGLIPDDVRFRPDKASPSAMLEALVRAPGCADAIEPLLSMRVLADLGLVEPKRFAAALGGFPRTLGSRTNWMELWPAVAVEAFARGVLEGTNWPSERVPEGQA